MSLRVFLWSDIPRSTWHASHCADTAMFYRYLWNAFPIENLFFRFNIKEETGEQRVYLHGHTTLRYQSYIIIFTIVIILGINRSNTLDFTLVTILGIILQIILGIIIIVVNIMLSFPYTCRYQYSRYK